MADILGQAMLDYMSGSYQQNITTFSSVAGEDILPVPYLFRDIDKMPVLEKKALSLCTDRVLDIGCGSGSHAMHLQDKGLDVTGLDISTGAIATCRMRGLKKSICGDIYGIHGTKFDTVILLMNGIGVAANTSLLTPYLSRLGELLAVGGQVLLDSSDIVYMYEPEEIDPQTKQLIGSTKYYGEVSFRMQYNNQTSNSFEWLYLDFETLKAQCTAVGLSCELVMKGEHYDYLARLSHKK